MKICYYEQLEDISSQKSKTDIVNRLKDYSSAGLKTLLDYAFNPKIEWLLPKGELKYTPIKEGGRSLNTRLHQELRKLPNFLNIGPYPNLNPNKRLSLFIDVLETVHYKDAILLMHLKDKKLPFKNITKELAAKAYPIISKNWELPNDKTKSD